jgi:hypothetical protein
MSGRLWDGPGILTAWAFRYHDLRAGIAQRQGRGATDPRAATRYESNFVLQQPLHKLFHFFWFWFSISFLVLI